MPNAGQMRHVVRIEQRSTSQDASGDPVLVWTTFAKRRASLERTPGRELWASAARQGRVPTIFVLRYLDGVTPAMRIVRAQGGVDKVFNILSAIDPDGLRVDLVITCEELVEAVP